MNLPIEGSPAVAEVHDPAQRHILEMGERGIRVDPHLWLEKYEAALDLLATLEGDEHRERAANLELYGPPVFAAASQGDRVTAEWYFQGPGRFSCRDPFLHVISKSYGIRDAVVPEPGNVLVIADWRSSHLWVAAGLSGDAALLRELEDGDVYTRAAKAWCGKTEPEHRSVAKIACLSTLNGGGASSLATLLDTTPDVAKECQATWLSGYPKLRRYLTTTARSERSWSTPLGRRVEVPDDRADHQVPSWRWQSIEADALRMVLQAVQFQAVFCFFDEVILEVPEADGPEAEAHLRTVMDATFREACNVPKGDAERTVKVEQRLHWSKSP